MSRDFESSSNDYIEVGDVPALDITGNKITFFAIFSVAALSLFQNYDKKIIYILSGVLLLFSFGIIITLFSGEISFIEDLLIRRFLFTPALLNIQYFEFFENEETSSCLPINHASRFLALFPETEER